MSLSGYIIEKYNNMADAYTCHRLITEANKLKISLQLVGIYDTYINNGEVWNSGKKMSPKDFIINRYKCGKLKDHINILGAKSYNNINQFSAYVNKFEQLNNIKSNYFLIPKHILSTASIDYAFLVNSLGTPFIAKGLESSMGREIFLVDSLNSYLELSKKFCRDKEWLFEEFINTSYGKDMRVFTIRETPVACMIRKSNKDFRANVALGSTVEFAPVTEIIKKIAKDIYIQTQLDFLGIDLLFGEKNFFFCEINVMPGLKGIESASGINIAQLIIETIKTDFENE